MADSGPEKALAVAMGCLSPVSDLHLGGVFF